MFENVDPTARWEISRQLEYDLEHECDEDDDQHDDMSSDSEEEKQPKPATAEQLAEAKAAFDSEEDPATTYLGSDAAKNAIKEEM